MSERNSGGGPNLALLLLIPAAVIVAKGAARHRDAMWESGWASEGPSGFSRGHGHGHGYGPRGFGGDMEAGAFRLPPRIESMLDAWHTRAHKKADAAEAVDATGSETETA
jgi:hypothetical protein